jgi:hypothetical protein
MADYRLKIKIGDHEFDAEGAAEVVQAQFEVFKELILSVPAKATQRTPAAANGNGGDGENGDKAGSAGQLELDKIMKLDGRVVSLTVRAASQDDAVLLTLLGQRQYRDNNSVTGGEIKDGLRQSGQPIDRVDRVLDKLSADTSGLVITIGQHKGRRYRLTNAGITRAHEVARNLIATVP